MLVVAITKPVRYRWPGGEARLIPGHPVELPEDRARKLLAKAPGKIRVVVPLVGELVDTVTDTYRSVYAVKIGGSLIGDYWFCLSDTECFDPLDGLPVYRPSEIKALAGKGYGLEALQAVHRAKASMEGKIILG